MNGDTKTVQYAVSTALRHGGFFFGHDHYDIMFLDVPQDMPKKLVEEAAIDSFKITQKLLGHKVRLLEIKQVPVEGHKEQLRSILRAMGGAEVTVHGPIQEPRIAIKKTAKKAAKKVAKKA